MNWAALFLRSQGRIGRSLFWLGFAVLAGLQAGACMVPNAGWLAFMFLAYAWICLYAKRLHDMGRSGWLILCPILVSLLGLSAAAAFWLHNFNAKSDSPSLFWVSIGSLGGACLIDMMFVAWVGISPSEADENPYGPAPHPDVAVVAD